MSLSQDMSLTQSNLDAHNNGNDSLDPSTPTTPSSISDHSSTSSSSYHHRILRSVNSLRKQFLEDVFAHRDDRIARIFLGYVAFGSKVLTTAEMEDEMSRFPEVTRSFADCLPVASLEGAAFVGWRVKGATFPRMADA